MQDSEVEEVLEFWFGALDSRGRADREHAARWYKRDAGFDAAIAQRFGALHAAAAQGERDAWLRSTRGRLALVIVLDQFSRNLHRGDPRSFACDPRALSAAREGVALGVDRSLALDERGFLYMPFMHSEELADQDRCVESFARLAAEQTDEELRKYVDNSLDYAERHRAIVRRFGRFPHRNAVLGRSSTPEELEFLTQPGSSF
jgi:uncharacterized protein (DUF924 family)